MREHSGEGIDLILVGCVKSKRAHLSPARDLYTSRLWTNRQSYAEAHGCPWYILSAQHGLLHPDTLVGPYDLSLKQLSAKMRREWSQQVLEALIVDIPDLHGKTIEIHAGKPYAENGLEKGLRAAGAVVRRPLAHVVGLGPQNTWYENHIAAHRDGNRR